MTTQAQPMKRRRAAAAFIGAVVLLVAATPTLAQPPSDATTAEAAQFRETFGLNSDPALIASLADQPPTEPWSIPLTTQEADEMGRRVTIQDGLAQLHAYGRDNESVFGGVWIDQGVGAVVEVQFTDDPSRHAEAVRARIPAAAEIRLRQVPNSFADLEALATRIHQERETIASWGAKVYQVGPNVRTNRVELHVSALTDEIEAAFLTQYGSGRLDIRATAAPELTGCSSRDNCIGPPLRAGINTNYGCTTGFMSTEDGYNRFMTAGHCGNVGGATWWHNNSSWTIGDMKDDEYYNGSYADAATVGNISSTYMSNYVYYTASSSSLVLSKEGYNADTVGQTVCQSGRISGFTCGELYAKGFYITYGSVTLYDQRSATYNVAIGDSGAAVLAANKAMGIQSGKNDSGRAIYSHIYRVEAALGASVYLGS